MCKHNLLYIINKTELKICIDIPTRMGVSTNVKKKQVEVNFKEDGLLLI